MKHFFIYGLSLIAITLLASCANETTSELTQPNTGTRIIEESAPLYLDNKLWTEIEHTSVKLMFSQINYIPDINPEFIYNSGLDTVSVIYNSDLYQEIPGETDILSYNGEVLVNAKMSYLESYLIQVANVKYMYLGLFKNRELVGILEFNAPSYWGEIIRYCDGEIIWRKSNN